VSFEPDVVRLIAAGEEGPVGVRDALITNGSDAASGFVSLSVCTESTSWMFRTYWL
jgi:hypothetical protein